MASSLRSFQIFFLSFALLFFFTFADLIGDVCAPTRNPSRCSSALRSDPRSHGADRKVLGQISIDLAVGGAKSGVSLVTILSNGEKNPMLKEIYDSCLENYQDGVDNLNEANLDLKNGDFQGVNLKASAAQTDADTCDQNFQGSGAPAEPESLKAVGQNAQDLASIVLVISNQLRDGKL